jgi:glutamine synthetase
MVEQQFMPALLHYTDTLSSSIADKKAVADLPCTAETALLKDMSAAYESLYTLSEKLAADTAEAEGLTDNATASFFYHDTIIKDMDDIRAVADKAEVRLPKEFLPYPSYEEMLFYV